MYIVEEAKERTDHMVSIKYKCKINLFLNCYLNACVID